MKMTVKTGDNVLVIAGKDKGKSGKVSAVNAKEGTVLVENINIVTKHQKARTQNEKSGIFKRPAPIDASNVMVICPVCNNKQLNICKKNRRYLYLRAISELMPIRLPPVPV